MRWLHRDRVIAVLCFAAVFVTATDPILAIPMDTVAAALETITVSHTLPSTAWR